MPVNSLARITPENNEKFRPQPDRENAFMRASGGGVRLMRTSLCYPSPTYRSGSEKAAPLGKSGGAGLLAAVTVLKVALRRKVGVDRGMD